MTAPSRNRRRGLTPASIRLSTALARRQALRRVHLTNPRSELRAVEGGAANLRGIYPHAWEQNLPPQPMAWVHSGWFAGACFAAVAAVLVAIAMGWWTP